MNIEKICRTCMALSGPLLSIYDNASGSEAGCVADMLASFTKTQPKRLDNLPDKVCLSCISEINRCYSFKLKCENSNHILRQLLPNTVPEEPEIKIKSSQESKSVQTVLEDWQIETKHPQVQTDLSSHDSETPISTSNRERREISISKSYKIENEMIQQGEFIEVGPTRHMASKKGSIVCTNTKPKTSINVKEQTQNEEIEMELCDDNSQYHYEAEREISHDDGEGNESYYEITENEDPTNSENPKSGEHDSIGEEEYIMYSDGNGPDTVVFNLVCESDGEEFVAKSTNTARNVKSPKRKVEFNCSLCTMTFMSRKPLGRHMMKRHGWTNNDVQRAIAISKNWQEPFLVKHLQENVEFI